MVVIPRFKFEFTQIVSPLPAKKESNFQLKKSTIPTVSAGAFYEDASAYGVIDFDSGEVILSKNLSKRLPIASLTKIMTAVVALDLSSLDEVFTVSEYAEGQIPTKVMLKAGEKYSLRHLIASTLISSANDSAQVIKEGVDKKFGQDTFIPAMNAKAKFLGLKNTHFTNAQGFDNPDHFSTVEDLSLLAHYAMEQYPIISEIVRKEIEDLTNNNLDMRFYLQNWNGLLGLYPGIYGIKIGNTDDAGICTIVVSERAGKRIMAIILGAKTILQRDLWASELLDLGFNKVLNLKPINLTEADLKEKYATWKYFE